MEQAVLISVFDLAGPECWMDTDGQLLYDKFVPLLREGKKVALSFKYVEMITPTFLNAAIGQLYSEFTEEQIRELLSVTDLGPEDLADLKKVVDNAKRYFASKDKKSCAFSIDK